MAKSLIYESDTEENKKWKDLTTGDQEVIQGLEVMEPDQADSEETMDQEDQVDTEEILALEETVDLKETTDHEKCMTQLVQNVEKHAKFPLNQLKANQFIVMTVL
jgi:hypothetical protein